MSKKSKLFDENMSTREIDSIHTDVYVECKTQEERDALFAEYFPIWQIANHRELDTPGLMC